MSRGFTLIELSIVLVIIGLIVGGVLVGQDLIRAAGVRSQVSQIEKYNTAAHTFQGKYGYLPGDMTATAATQFGFIVRGAGEGQGDGNGVLEGYDGGTVPTYSGIDQTAGETAVFWVDLSQSQLIAELLNTATESAYAVANGVSVALYMPSAKINSGSFISTYSFNETNYFCLSGVTHIGYGEVDAIPSLSVTQAYSIDAKMDDGLPQSGKVLAQYLSYQTLLTTVPRWAAGGSANVGGWQANNAQGALPGSTATPSSATCYDNGGNANNIMQYSVGYGGGTGVNCALSFQFQ